MNKKSLEKAADKAVTESRRNMLWPVYREYRVEYHNDLPVLVAPEPLPRFAPARDGEGQPVKNEGSQVLGFREIDSGIEQHYAPLLRPEIVLRLADLGDSRRAGPLTLEKMQTWAETWGLLGVRDESGRMESFVDFGVAARNVSRTLRLFEAATANEGEGDKGKLRSMSITGGRGSQRDLRERALDEVEMNVSEALRARTYHAQYRLRDRQRRTVGFDQGQGFHDLLGAVYLLLSYLIRDPNTRRCKNEACQRFIDPEKYSDSKFCSARCKQKAYRERVKKQARKVV